MAPLHRVSPNITRERAIHFGTLDG